MLPSNVTMAMSPLSRTLQLVITMECGNQHQRNTIVHLLKVRHMVIMCIMYTSFCMCLCVYLALVTLKLVDSNMVSSDIDCPGDTLTYNCSIESNSETLHLTWNITFPEEIPIDFTFNSTSILFTWYDWDIGVRAVLTGYSDQEYVNSTIIFTLMNNITLNGTELECSITDLGSETAILYTNTSGMCVANHIFL